MFLVCLGGYQTGGKTPTPKIAAFLRKRCPVLAGTKKRPYRASPQIGFTNDIFVAKYRWRVENRPTCYSNAQGEIPKSAMKGALEGALGNRGAQGSAPESALEPRGCSVRCFRVLFMLFPHIEHPGEHLTGASARFQSTLQKHFLERPDFPEHLPEHPSEHFSGFPLEHCCSRLDPGTIP